MATGEPPKNLKESVRQLVARCERVEPPFVSLGAPYIGHCEEAQAIVDLGSDAVPVLCELLPEATPRGAAYIAFCLGEMGDPQAVPSLQKALRKYQDGSTQGAFELAFIGNARVALERLRET